MSDRVVIELDYEFGGGLFFYIGNASRLHVTRESIRENADILLEVLAPEVEAKALQIIRDREEDKAQRHDRERDCF